MNRAAFLTVWQGSVIPCSKHGMPWPKEGARQGQRCRVCPGSAGTRRCRGLGCHSSHPSLIPDEQQSPCRGHIQKWVPSSAVSK